MTRRGLFKLLAATPLAGIVAKFAPKQDTCYLGNYAGHGLFNPAKAIPIDKDYLAGMKNMPFAFWFDGPEVPKTIGGDTVTVKTPTMSEWKNAASILDDIDKRFSSTDKYFKPNRANIQS